jgi:hypothetical protein
MNVYDRLSEAHYEKSFATLDAAAADCCYLVTRWVEPNENQYAMGVFNYAWSPVPSFEDVLAEITEDLNLPKQWMDLVPSSLLEKHQVGDDSYSYYAGGHVLVMFGPVGLRVPATLYGLEGDNAAEAGRVVSWISS